MRSVVNTPEGVESVEIRDVEPPVPSAGTFVVDVAAFSVNRGELALIKMRPEGWRPGQDVAGTVVAAATDGTGPAVGTRVVGVVDGGGWSEQVAVPVDRYAPLPDQVSFEQAASLPIAGLTALRTLREGGDLLGRRVLVTGANGGVGRFQIELAAVAGAKVTAVTTRTEQAEDLEDLGAQDVVSSVEDAQGPYSLILESLGGPALTTSVAKIAPRGTIVVLGNSTGEPSPVNVFDFIGHEGARLQNYMSYASSDPDDADLGILVGLVAAGQLHPTLGHVAPWTEVVPALSLLAERKVDGGKVVLTTA